MGENLTVPANGAILWRAAALWAAAHVGGSGQSVRQVRLVEHFSAINPPGVTPSRGSEQEKTLYVLTVSPSGGAGRSSELDAPRSAWERFWFSPQPTSTLAVVRIAFGLLVLGWTLSLAGDLDAFFSHSGLVASQPSATWLWGVLGVFGSDLAVQILYGVLLVACVALILGYHTRLAAVLVFVGVLSFERRNPFVTNAGDGLIRLMAFYLMLTPAGVALSLDRRRTARGRFWEFPSRPVWGLRLMQIQLSVIYLAGLWAKLEGTTWNNGTAVSYAMRILDVSRFAPPGFVTHSLLISNLMTYGTLAIEASIGILVWNRRLRPWVLLAGVLLHLGIEVTIRVGFFSLAILTLYLAFLDPDWTRDRLLAIRDRFARARRPIEDRKRAEAPQVAAGALPNAPFRTGTSEPPSV